MANIRSLIKVSNRVLFTDDEFFNKDVTGIKNLTDLKDMLSIRGSLKRIAHCGNYVQYKLNGSTYTFTLTFVV